MSKRLMCGACALVLAAAAGCGGNSGADNSNAGVASNTNASNSNASNSNAVAANTSGAAEKRTMPDGSVVTTETVNGVTTETRSFTDSKSRVERVVVTTRDGRKTARVYYRDKTVRELPEGDVERALTATGDAIVSAGGKVVDVSKEAGAAVADKAEDIPSEADDAARATAKGAKKVGTETADKAEDVGGATVNGAKKAGKATAKGAKKVGGAIKDAVTP